MDVPCLGLASHSGVVQLLTKSGGPSTTFETKWSLLAMVVSLLRNSIAAVVLSTKLAYVSLMLTSLPNYAHRPFFEISFHCVPSLSWQMIASHR